MKVEINKILETNHTIKFLSLRSLYQKPFLVYLVPLQGLPKAWVQTILHSNADFINKIPSNELRLTEIYACGHSMPDSN